MILSALTRLRFLLGSRRAIVDVATSRSALLTGILRVISAGVTRESDGESLLHQPWHLRRHGASLDQDDRAVLDALRSRGQELADREAELPRERPYR